MDHSWENDTSAPFPSLGSGNLVPTVPSPAGSASPSLAPPTEASSFPPQEGRSTPPFWNSPLNQGLSVFVGLALCVTMLGLGCTVELSQLGAQLRRPLGLLLALLCQFGLMPLVAFLLALIFALDEVAAVAVLLCGCCPGGNLSNLMSLLVNGDMNLSIIMTISSTLLALVLMPLCLWIYSHAWINTPLVRLLPLGAVTLTLCSTLLPIGLGVFIRYRYTRVADILLKLIGSMYMFPLLYALFQSAEAGLFVLAYKIYGKDFYKQEPLVEEDEDTDISYKKLKEEEVPDTSYGTVIAEGHGSAFMEPTQTAL
ncbi:sodium/bile acid cotransporter 4 isoform X2 [Varanus komodoensis]|uniref:sodium/bile acid cotransporter 4 isoform X2 n=1 Tax=Varanus komodoensis TaxID=61221 RepID=UPI001CF7A341|nr:sodium/bile acid cotransporter 4 isoform X2 [Varanus komodoensis]